MPSNDPVNSPPGQSLDGRMILWILLCTVVALGPSLWLGFLQDDHGVVRLNSDLTLEKLPDMAGPGYWSKELPFDDPWRPGHYLYRPVPVTMFALEKAAFGLRAWAFRITNLLLHALTSLLVAALALRLLKGSRRARTAALFAGCFFAVHAVHFESVVHIVGRAELGMAAGTLAAALLALRVPSNRLWLAAVVGCSILATGFKEQGILGPLLVLGLALTGPRPWRRGTTILYLVLTALWLGGYFALRDHAIGGYGPDKLSLSLGDVPFMDRAAIMSSALVEYARLLLFPIDPLLDYLHLKETEPRTFFALKPAVGLILGLGIPAGIAVAVRKKSGLLLLGWLAVVIGLGPVSNLLLPIGAVMAERFLYLPSAGICLLLLPGLVPILNRRAGRIGGVAVLLLMTLLCWHHAYDFAHPLVTARRFVKRHPHAPRLMEMAGKALEQHGQLEEAGNVFERWEELAPDNDRIPIHRARVAVKTFRQQANASGTPEAAPDGAWEKRLRAHLRRLKPLGNLEDAPFIRALIHFLFDEFDRARLEFLHAVFNGERSRFTRFKAAVFLLNMEERGLGTRRLGPDIRASLREVVNRRGLLPDPDSG